MVSEPVKRAASAINENEGPTLLTFTGMAEGGFQIWASQVTYLTSEVQVGVAAFIPFIAWVGFRLYRRYLHGFLTAGLLWLISGG